MSYEKVNKPWLYWSLLLKRMGFGFHLYSPGKHISVFNIFIYLFWVFIEVEVMEPSCHDVTLTPFCVCSGMLSASFKAPNNCTHIGGALEVSIILTMAQKYNQNNCLVLLKQRTRFPWPILHRMSLWALWFMPFWTLHLCCFGAKSSLWQEPALSEWLK